MLKVTGIEKRYGKKQVLTGLNLEAEPGQCIGIAGDNGCGKTTFLSILAGAAKPDGGSIRFQDQEAVGKPKVFTTYAAYVPQENPLILELSAKDNLLLWHAGTKEQWREGLKTGAAAMLGVADFLDMPAGKLSGGQKKRLSIACALSGQPKVLILDEPGASLDLACKEEIRSYLKSFCEAGGIVILTSHELEELSICDRLFVLKEGQLFETSPGLTSLELLHLF